MPLPLRTHVLYDPLTQTSPNGLNSTDISTDRSVEVSGKQADIVVDRLQRGDRVCVRGQLVQREYNDKLYLDVKNASVTFMEDRRDSPAGGGDSPF